MSFEMLFSICSSFAAAGWLLMVLAPRWRWTARLVISGAWALALSLVYLVLAVVYLPFAEGGFGSIGEVRLLFSNDALLLAGWVHYLAFDLLVGAWELRKAREEAIPHLLVIPCLILTFLAGPVGLVLFVTLRAIRRRRVEGIA